MNKNECVNCGIKTAFINSMQESLDAFSIQVHKLKQQIGELKKKSESDKKIIDAKSKVIDAHYTEYVNTLNLVKMKDQLAEIQEGLIIQHAEEIKYLKLKIKELEGK